MSRRTLANVCLQPGTGLPNAADSYLKLGIVHAGKSCAKRLFETRQTTGARGMTEPQEELLQIADRLEGLVARPKAPEVLELLTALRNAADRRRSWRRSSTG